MDGSDDKQQVLAELPGSEKPAVKSTFADDIDAISKIDAVVSILEVVCRTTGARFSAVARVTEERWIACAVRDEIEFGLKPGEELEVKTTICDEIRASNELVVIDHASEDPKFCCHLTPHMYGFQSYISVPINLQNGDFFGTLCALDPEPIKLNTTETVGMFQLFADLIAFHLNTQKRLQISESALMDERQTAQLREQFFAILSHDLRNPLNAVTSGSELLLRMSLPDRADKLVALIKRSATRMNGMIENTLDFAQTRLGSGLSTNRVVTVDLSSALEQIIAETNTVWSERKIESDIVISQAVFCDTQRVAQMFSNLLANALIHSNPDSPVWVSARTDSHGFKLSVANLCEPIDPQVLKRLFQPYKRASERAKQQGLGLGLYIASEIAKAHEGTLEVTSSIEETRFTFHMAVLVSEREEQPMRT